MQYSVTLQEERQVGRTVDCTVAYRYDKEGNLSKKVVTHADGAQQTVYYETNEGNTIAKLTVGERTVTAHSGTDSFGRKLFDELQFGTGVLSRAFEYHKGAVTEEHSENGKIKSTPTTQLVSLITLSDGRTIAYEYDAEERITKVTDSIDGVTEYTYDALGQLLTETVNGEVVNTMMYDNYGNILSKNGKSYTYGDGVWKDLLTAYDGQTISYDAQGNPISYLGHTLTWEKGRQLKSFDSNTYTYNANGIRTSKTVGGVTHTYTLDGTKILREVWDGNTLVPLYDNEDSVCGIVYNNEPHFFIKNLQGDVIAIANARGEVEARYSYDAWGVPTVTLDASDCQIATVNPFRYRGYYYDAEIAKYYLQSRYYDPVTGRFVNGDAPSGIRNFQNKIKNLFEYCLGNPIAYNDTFGFSITLAAVVSVGAKILGVLLLLFAAVYIFDRNFRNNVNRTILSVLTTLDAGIRAIISFAVDVVSDIKTLPIRITTAAVFGLRYLTNVISEIAELAEKRRHYKQKQVHHIVAKTDVRAAYARQTIEKNGVSRNHSYNLVTVSNTLHRHLHTNSYFAAIDIAIYSAVSNAKTKLTRHVAILSCLKKIAGILQFMDMCIS